MVKKCKTKVQKPSMFDNMEQQDLFEEKDEITLGKKLEEIGGELEKTIPNYHSLDDTPKEVEKGGYGLFGFPDVKGVQKMGEAKFLVFYFDNQEDYDLVVRRLGEGSAHVREHPKMDTGKLVKLLNG